MVEKGTVYKNRLELIYSDEVVQRVSWQLETFRESGMEAQAVAMSRSVSESGPAVPRAREPNRITRNGWAA